MIFIVHSLYFIIKLALKVYRKRRAVNEFQIEATNRLQEEANQKDHNAVEERLFDTPVYRQRYIAVQQVLLDQRWRKDVKKVVDFGCAELEFFRYVRHLFGLTEVLEVDLNRELLEEYKYKAQPFTADYLRQRTDPLIVDVLCGSIGDPDYRLANVDAVVAIEIIEHLYPDTIDKMVYNIFGFINPRVAIFTTPNADFNVLFPNFKIFRHDDHKFEWSRQEFEDWANNVCSRFQEYSVEFHGIGKGPRGTESLGCCSQMAVFIKQYSPVLSETSDHIQPQEIRPNESSGVCTYYSYSQQMTAFVDDPPPSPLDSDSRLFNKYYKLIDRVSFPYTEDNRSSEQKILDSAMYMIYRNGNVNNRFFNEDTQMVEIPLCEIISDFEGIFVSEDELKKILLEADFTIGECVFYDAKHPCVVYDINMDNTSPASSEGDSAEAKLEQEIEHNLNSSAGSDTDWEQELEMLEDKKRTDASASSPVEPSEQLFDSGYQKSISNAEWSPQSPLADGVFEEQFSNCMKLDVNDIKDNLKCSSKKSPQKESQPSTSDSKKKRQAKLSDGDSDSLRDEVKHITNCIVYNSLNKLNVDDEVREVPPLLPVLLPEPEPQYIVENGDLANNNRDDQGNNYPELPVDIIENNDNENRDVAENNIDLPVELNVNHDDENQNVAENPEVPVVAGAAALPLVDYEDDDAELEADDTLALNHASREALFDPNSQLDMLEEYVLPDPSQNEEDVRNAELVPLLVEYGVNREENDVENLNPFPNWLLQLLGQPLDEENQDEAHFYCQGDGIGVHPSVVVVDVETSSSDSTTNDEAQAEHTISEDDVGALPNDNSVAQPQNALQIVGHSVPVRQSQSAISNDSTEEFFDTIEDNSVDSCPGNKRK